MLVKFDETLSKQTIKLIEKVLFLHTAMNKDFDNLTLLLFLKIETRYIFKGLHIVLG